MYYLREAHAELCLHSDLMEEFRSILNLHTKVVDEAAIENVYNELIRKVCNTHIQEFFSARKQEFGAKKGLALIVDLNLQASMLSHHTKLASKLT